MHCLVEILTENSQINDIDDLLLKITIRKSIYLAMTWEIFFL